MNIKEQVFKAAEQVFKAAEQGELYSIKVLLEEIPDNIRDFLNRFPCVAESIFLVSPLLAACKNGHLDIVFYLIKDWGVNIEQTCFVSTDKDLEGGTALWYAASSGHLEICKLLRKHKASVNGVARGESTPLHAASCHGHLKIVKYLIQEGSQIDCLNGKNQTCLMIACFMGHYEIVKFLLNYGADVNIRSAEGRTALHECATIDIIKILLEFGAEVYYDLSGHSPLFIAAALGRSSIFGYMIQALDSSWSQLEVINALELLGAAVVFYDQDTYRAREYWKWAMLARFNDEEFPFLKPKPSLLEQYIGYYEPRKLNELISTDDINLTKLESILITQRIFGPGFPDNMNRIKVLSRWCMEKGFFTKSLLLLKYPFDINYETEFGHELIINLDFVLEIFSIMLHTPTVTIIPKFSFEHLLFVLKKTLKAIADSVKPFDEDECFTYHEVIYNIYIKILHLIGFMYNLKSRPASGYDDIQLKIAVSNFVKLDLKTAYGMTPLHLFAKVYRILNEYSIPNFPFCQIIQLLLEVGASPNAMDHYNNTPLHVVAMNFGQCTDIFILLLKHKAHLDLRNKKRKTPLQLVDNLFPLDICPLQYINLQCLCAKTIRGLGIPYVNFVPEAIRQFVYVH